MSGTIIQFKLISGEEIVCEVVDFPSEDDDDFTIKNALILLRNSTNPTEAQYVFKPWIAMMESDTDYISLSSSTVMALCEPTSAFQKEYVVAKTQLHSISKMRQSYYERMDDEYINSILDDLQDVFGEYEEEDERKSTPSTGKKIFDKIVDGDYDKPKQPDKTKAKILKFPTPDDDDTIH